MSPPSGSNGPATDDGMLFEMPQRPIDIAVIHQATAIYTVIPEVEALLDRLNWPVQGQRLLDPGAGNGGFVISALSRVSVAIDDVDSAVDRVRGYEFFPGAVAEARRGVSEHLECRGWSSPAARRAASLIIEEKDFLLDDVPSGHFDVIAANPPYWRLTNLPPDYRNEYEMKVEPHAKADLLYAYLARSAAVLQKGGRIGLITSDRWLLNGASAELRGRIGQQFTVNDAFRLDPDSTFYRAKIRTKGSLARVHPVTMVLSPEASGRALSSDPFVLDEPPEVDGPPLRDLVEIRLAPWLGPDGVFLVADPKAFPPECTVPVVLPSDINPKTDQVGPPTRWALITNGGKPHPSVLAHLQSNQSKMPAGAQRSQVWLPPESFEGRLPLNHDAVLVPRIAKHLRAVRLPAGRLPVNHGLVLVAGCAPEIISRIINDPLVQEQADALALGVDSGYNSYTATLLRRLSVPNELLQQIERDTGVSLVRESLQVSDGGAGIGV